MKVLMGEALNYNSLIHVGSHHYADLFAAHGHEVFWLGGTLHPLNLLRAAQGVATEQELARIWRSGGTRLSERMQTYHPLTLLPYRNRRPLDSKAVLERTLQFTVPPVRGVLRRHAFDHPDLLWLSQSHASLAILRTVSPRKMAYRMSDSYMDFGTLPESMREAEAEIIRAADVIFVTARKIEEEAHAIRSDRIVYLPNGVDFDHFHANRAPEPEDIRALPHPRVVYVGSLSHWFDPELLAHAARALPDFAFLIIGRVQTDLNALQGLSNVHILGPRPYPVLPPYLRHSDVAIIPFQKIPLTDATNPVKLFEYFAAGLPVVSVRLNEVEQLQSPTLLTESRDAFVDALCQAVDGGRDRPEFVEFARANSWANRYRTIQQYCF